MTKKIKEMWQKTFIIIHHKLMNATKPTHTTQTRIRKYLWGTNLNEETIMTFINVAVVDKWVLLKYLR